MLSCVLRYTWLDSCEHVSSFDFGEQLEGSPIAAKLADVEYEDEAEEIVWDATMNKLLRPRFTFGYECDPGTPTELTLKVIGENHAMLLKRGVRILALNNAPSIACSVCNGPAACCAGRTVACANAAPAGSRAARRPCPRR